MAKSVLMGVPEPFLSADSPTTSAFVRALGELGHGVLVLEGERIVDVSHAFCELVGYERSTLLDMRSAFELAEPEARPALRALLRRYVAGEDVGRRFSIPIRRLDGTPIKLDVAVKSVASDGRRPRLLVVANDVTDRADYHDQLQFQKRLLEAIAETSPDGILVVGADRRMTYFNRRFVELWRIPDEVVATRRDEAALAAVRDQIVDPEPFLDRVAYFYEHPLEASHDELRLRDGRVIERYGAPIVDAGGAARGRVWFFRDVSDARTGLYASELLAMSGQLFGTSLEVEETLSQLADLVVPRMADWAAVDVLDDTEHFRRVGVAHVDPEGAQILRELHERYPLRPNEGRLRGRVVATLEPIALYDVDERELRSLARDDDHFGLLNQLGIRSAMWVPLIVRDRVVGVLSAGYRSASRRYSPADLSLLRELARRAALAVDNAILYRAIQRAERRQAAIASLGQDALAGMPYGQLAQSAAQSLAVVMSVPFVEVLQMRPDEDLLLVGGVGWADGLVGRATVRAGLGSQAGYTLATVGPVVLDDLATETRFTPPPLLADHGVVSGVTVVIGSPSQPYGVLGAHTGTHRVFAEDDVNFLQAVANVLAAAIERQRNEDRLNSLAIAEEGRAAQLKAVIESIGDAVVVCDVLGVVVLANPSAEQLLGNRLTEGLAGILHAFEWPVGREAGALQPGEGIELRLAHGGGRAADDGSGEQWIELSVFPVVGGDERLSASGGTVLVMRDVTSARNARAVRDAFVGILSHELRTPVTTIYGGAEMLARRGATVDEAGRREVYEDIRAEADRLYRLIENLLVLSRVERQGLHIETEPVLLQRLIPRVIEAESDRWAGSRFEIELPAGLPPVAAEETYLEQILRNLLGNAAKYGGDGAVLVNATDLGPVVRVTVADHGPGFPKAEKEQLFELFYRSPALARTASGAGIGLFVSRQLVRAMNGRMWAANRRGGGAEFGFEVPVFATAD